MRVVEPKVEEQPRVYTFGFEYIQTGGLRPAQDYKCQPRVEINELNPSDRRQGYNGPAIADVEEVFHVRQNDGRVRRYEARRQHCP